MSSLAERVEGLVAGWRSATKAISAEGHERPLEWEGKDILRLCADELAAALAAEGQGELTEQQVSNAICYTQDDFTEHSTLDIPETTDRLNAAIRAASPALPLQRTLPDEQFKGAVVEPIGVEKAQVELGQELSDYLPMFSHLRRAACVLLGHTLVSGRGFLYDGEAYDLKWKACRRCFMWRPEGGPQQLELEIEMAQRAARPAEKEP